MKCIICIINIQQAGAEIFAEHSSLKSVKSNQRHVGCTAATLQFLNCLSLHREAVKMFLLFKAIALIWLRAEERGAMRAFVPFDVTS